MVVTIRYTLFILICMLCQSAFSAVDIVLCEDSDGNLSFDLENEFIKGCLVTHEGNITHEMTKNIIEENK